MKKILYFYYVTRCQTETKIELKFSRKIAGFSSGLQNSAIFQLKLSRIEHHRLAKSNECKIYKKIFMILIL